MAKQKLTKVSIFPRYLTSLPLFADEKIVFTIRSSLFVLITKIIGLAILDAAITYLFIQFKLDQALGLIKYEFWVNLAPTIVVGFVTTVVLLDWLTIKYTLTNKRVEATRGILGTYSQSIVVDRIHSALVKKTLLGRIFNYGTIIIKSAAYDFKISFANISSPDQRNQEIEDQIRP